MRATIEGLWRATDAKAADLKETLASAAIEQVHHQALGIWLLDCQIDRAHLPL
jgi:hypothetical protein